MTNVRTLGARLRGAWIPVGLWLAALLVYAWLTQAVNASRLLTGEESSVAFLNVLGLDERFQFSFYATNFGGHVFYWVASHLDPSPDLFYGRRWKAAAMALVAPLVYLLLHRRGAVGRAAAATGAATAVLLPGVSSFSWLATENGLEAVWGLCALLAVTSRRPWWPLGLVLAGVAVSTYGAGLAWAAGAAAAALWRVARSDARARDAALGAAGGLAGIGVVFFPRIWWTNSGYIVTGGGTSDVGNAGDNLSGLASELLEGADGSYYFFDGRPALAGAAIAILGLLGLALALAEPRRRGLWPLLVVLVGAVGLYGIAGGVLGVRRAIAIPVIAACGVGVLADWVLTVAAARLGTAGDLGRARGRMALAAVLAAALVVPLGLSLRGWRDDVRAGRQTLPSDFVFPLAPGETMPEVLGAIRNGLRDGSLAPERVVSVYEGERTLAMVRLLAERNGQSTRNLPTGRAITQLSYESPRCFQDCRPVPGRP